jgi:hypothetical protein
MPAGQKYWETHYLAGAVTADGHVNRTLGRQVDIAKYGRSPAKRKAAGQAAGAYAEAQQKKLLAQAREGMSLTPVGGGVVSAIDLQKAIRHKDPLGGGLAALGLIPGVGIGGRAARDAIKGTEAIRGAVKAERTLGGVARGRRTLQVGEKVQQLPRARSRITQTLIETPADVASGVDG